MTRKPSGARANLHIDKALKGDPPSQDVKGAKFETVTHVPTKKFPVKQQTGAKHGIINVGQPPKKFKAR